MLCRTHLKSRRQHNSNLPASLLLFVCARGWCLNMQLPSNICKLWAGELVTFGYALRDRVRGVGGRHSGEEEPGRGPASERLTRSQVAGTTECTRSNPGSSRGGGGGQSAATSDVSAAQKWLREQRRSTSSAAELDSPAVAAEGRREQLHEAERRAGRVLVAAAAGYEGEAAVVAVAHIMRQGLSPHQALVAASQRHVALHVRAHPHNTHLPACTYPCA